MGVVLTLIITAIDGYSREAVARPGMFGGAPFGWAGFGQRMIECLSYFTEWSNILVAIVATLIALRGSEIGRGDGAVALMRAHDDHGDGHCLSLLDPSN